MGCRRSVGGNNYRKNTVDDGGDGCCATAIDHRIFPVRYLYTLACTFYGTPFDGPHNNDK